MMEKSMPTSSYCYSFVQESNDKKILVLQDHIDGFDEGLNNSFFDKNKNKQIWTQLIVNQLVKEKYKDIDFKFYGHYSSIDSLQHIRTNKKSSINNFLCSFNGSDGVGRQFAVSMLKRKNLWHNQYCSKNFTFDIDRLDGNIARYCTTQNEPYYRNLILGETEDYKLFYNSKNSFEYRLYDHKFNIDFLSKKIHDSFIQLVVETIAVSYHPWITEKFLYPLVYKTLWIGYAQPGYYEYLEKYYNFKKFSKIFDYSFDYEKNPVIRLEKIFLEIEKYRHLSYSDLTDLYQIEKDTIDHNYENYISGEYLKNVAPYIDSKDPKLIIENYNNNCYY